MLQAPAAPPTRTLHLWNVFQGLSTSALLDLGSILSPLGSDCEFASVLWKTDDTHNWRCEQAVLSGETPHEAPFFFFFFLGFYKPYWWILRRKPVWTVPQKQNIPSDYEIPISSVTKEVVRKSTAVFGPTRFGWVWRCAVDLRRPAAAGWPWTYTLWSRVSAGWPACSEPSPPTGSTSASSYPCWRASASPSTTRSWWVPGGLEEEEGSGRHAAGGGVGVCALSGLNNSDLEMTCGCPIPQEAAMQLFQCHYQERALMSGLYFDYIKDILQAAASQEVSGLSCKPPPCPNLHPSPGSLAHLRFSLLLLNGCLERQRRLRSLLEAIDFLRTDTRDRNQILDAQPIKCTGGTKVGIKTSTSLRWIAV